MIRKIKTHIITFIVLCLFFQVSSYAHAPINGFADLLEPLLPAVVNVSTTQKLSNQTMYNSFGDNQIFDDLGELLERFGMISPYNDFNKQATRKATSLGSGFIIDPAGYIVTNHHVISEAEEVSVKLSDDREFKASIIGYDVKTDLALLKIDVQSPLPYVKFGDSDNLRTGDIVITVGNPFGLGGTVTSGIVSARSRDINANGLVDNFIQTDAAINRGNSGGPMFNSQGEVVGINSVILSPSNGNVGIGFATPANLAKTVLDQLQKNGKVVRGWLGVVIQPIEEDIVESLGLQNKKGALVSEIYKDSPAEKAKILPGDVIISINSKEVNNARNLAKLIAEIPIGKKTSITYLRNGKEQKTEVILVEVQDSDQSITVQSIDKDNEKDFSNLYGLSLAPINPELSKKYGIEPQDKGLIILKVDNRTSWGKTRLQKGDIIIAANQNEPINSISDLKKIIQTAIKQNKKSILLLIKRENNTIFIAVPIPN